MEIGLIPCASQLRVVFGFDRSRGGGLMVKCATMQSQEPSSERRHPGMVSAIKGSLWIAAGVLLWDVGCEGCYNFSTLICPLWFLISVVKNSAERPGWGIGLLRVSIPLLTFAITFGNGSLQWKLSDAHAEQVIKACDEFRVANGRYPSKLDDLVPKYLPSVPPAKYCMGGNFCYVNSEGHPMLWWTRYGFYRRLYYFDKRRWGNVD